MKSGAPRLWRQVASLLRPASLLVVVFTILLGLVYPLIMTGFAQTIFPARASGSFVRWNGHTVGSQLLGQTFSERQYFWGRPSAAFVGTAGMMVSSGSNLGARNPALRDAIAGRVAGLRAADPDNALLIPADLVTASASGLDPHITPAGARYQAARIARARGVTTTCVLSLIDESVERPWLGLFGERRVNVLRLNLALEDPAHSDRESRSAR